MKFTDYLQSREVGFLPKHLQYKLRQCAELLSEKQSVNNLKNSPCKLSGQTRATFLVDFSTDKTKVASTHGDHTVRVSDIVSGKTTHVLVGHPRTPWCLAFHPSSNDILASGCLGGEVRIWDLLGGGSEVWQAPNGTVIASLTFHPTDHVLLFATSNSVYFWDWSEPEPFAVCQTNYEYEKVRWLGFDPLGHYIYTGITNVATIHREDPPNIAPVRERASQPSRLRNNWPRYQHLVERFHSYQRLRGRHQNHDGDDDTDEEVAIPPRSLSPTHIDGINMARQFAAEVTVSSTRARETTQTSYTPRINSPMPVNYLWDINENNLDPSALNSDNSTRRPRIDSSVPIPPMQPYPHDPRTRDWSPPPRVSPEEVDSVFDEEIDRFNSRLRRPDRGYRSRYSARLERRLSHYPEFLRRRDRTSDRTERPSTRPARYLSNRTPELNTDRFSAPDSSRDATVERILASYDEFRPRLIDRWNENISISPPLTSATSTTTVSSIFSTVPHVSTRFPPTRITGLRPSYLSFPSSSASTSTSTTPSNTRGMSAVVENIIVNGCLSGHCPTTTSSASVNNDNLVVQRQSEGNGANTATSSQTITPIVSSVSGNETLFVDQPLPAPSNSEESRTEQSCSRTRPSYRTLERCGSTISRLRRQLAACRNSRQRMLRHSRVSLSRTPQPESFRNPQITRPDHLPISRHSSVIPPASNSVLFSSGADSGVGSSRNTSTVLRRHWSPPGDNRTIVTDRTSQTSGTMNEPEYADQGTDVIGLNLELEIPDNDRIADMIVNLEDVSDLDILPMEDIQEHADSNYILYDSDTITDSSLTFDLDATDRDENSNYVSVPDNESLDVDPLFVETLNPSRDELEPVYAMDESLASTSTTSTLSGLNDSSSSASDLASVSSLCQFVNHYNQSSPINITSEINNNNTTTISSNVVSSTCTPAIVGNNFTGVISVSDSTNSAVNSTITDTRTRPSDLLTSLGLTPTSLGVSNTVIVSTAAELNNDDADSLAALSTVASNASVSNNSGGSTPSLPDDESTNNCPAHTVLRHHAYLASATARLERRISELDQRIGRSNSAISSSGLNNREDLASITARLERQVSELDQRINALRQSFTERLRALHQDRDRILSMRDRPAGEQDQSVLPPVTTATSPLPRITITRPRDENRGSENITPSTAPDSSRNGQTLLESFLRHESSASGQNSSSSTTSSSNRTTTSHRRNPTVPSDRPPPPPEDESWRSLQQIHLHPHYSASILDDTINRPNDALQAAIHRAIAGAFMVGVAEGAVANNIVPQSHRIQWWDFTQYRVPDLRNSKSNIVVPVCKLHNDASCDISADGTRLATFVPSHRGFPDDNILAVFSLESHNFGHCLYTKSFGPNAISVSISPKNDHIIIGLAAKRLSWVFTTHQLVAQIYSLKEAHAGEDSMKHVTDVFHTCDSDVRTHVSVNSARWLPRVGEGIVYGTNRGDLVICRPRSKVVIEKAEYASVSTSAETSEGAETLDAPRINLLNLFLSSGPQTSTAGTQTISRGIRRTAGTQTSSSSSQDENFREPFIV